MEKGKTTQIHYEEIDKVIKARGSIHTTKHFLELSIHIFLVCTAQYEKCFVIKGYNSIFNE
jgi:hypothetical protein